MWFVALASASCLSVPPRPSIADCEQIGTTSDCSACGDACEGDTPLCAEQAGGYACVSTCPADECDGQCVDFQSDVDHCGDCETSCNAANAVPSCDNGTCAFECVAPFADCRAGSDGCETLLGTMTDCTDCQDPCGTREQCTAQGCDACNATDTSANGGQCNGLPLCGVATSGGELTFQVRSGGECDPGNPIVFSEVTFSAAGPVNADFCEITGTGSTLEFYERDPDNDCGSIAVTLDVQNATVSGNVTDPCAVTATDVEVGQCNVNGQGTRLQFFKNSGAGCDDNAGTLVFAPVCSP